MLRLAITAAVTLALPGLAAAQRWQDATAKCTGTTAQWSNKIEVADLDGDQQVDLLVANGGNYSAAGPPEPIRIWKNLGTWTAATACSEISAQAVLGFTGHARAIKAADVDHDGDLDIITGGAWQTQLRLYLREPTGWVDATDRLPQQLTSAGDLELGDVDGDGDLDLAIAEWGAVAPSPGYPGGRTRLYLNDGTGRFTDVTAARMPDLLVAWSWDAELADIDQDWDLDLLVSCKYCAANFVFRNDGTGTFTHDPAALPVFTNNYEFEPMDIDGDGDLDLMSINNGGQLRERLLVNDGTGKFSDETATRLAGAANPANVDDNAVVFLDVDSDGDADLFVASLSAPDRLLLNNGAGVFTISLGATPNDTPGSLGVAVADLDGDGRVDLVQAQGEAAFSEKVQLASNQVAVDTAPPVIARHDFVNGTIVARIHDHQSPSRRHDWQRVWLEHDGGETELEWYGEYLWRAAVAPPVGAFRLCARDRAGNESCVAPVSGDGMPADAGVDPAIDAGPDGGGAGGGAGGCCETGGGSPGGALALASLLALLLRRAQCQKPIDTARLR